MKLGNTYFECECTDPEDLVILKSFEWEVDPSESVEDSYSACLYVSKRRFESFWERVWTAFKYIFGWDHIVYSEVILSQETISRMQQALSKLEKK